MTIEVRRGADRFLTEDGGRTTRHSFSFGPFYDPANLGFAAMVAHNDELLPPGTGYDDHPHSNLEIVTWVLEGALRHTDSSGATGVLSAGDVQHLSTGSGIVHSEVTEPGIRTRFIQTWLRPERPGGEPTYRRVHGHRTDTLVEVAAVAGARLYLADPTVDTVVLPDAPRLHVFVAAGRGLIDDQQVGAGDTVRITDQGGRTIHLTEPGPIGVWAFSG
ncbi:MAG: pirin family protein [Propionibacteriales bacterium]|nr:pirin family protein [Propionibacteriales bacterium]